MLSGACKNSGSSIHIYPRTCCIVAAYASSTTRPNASARTSRFCKLTRPTMIQPRRFLALRRSALLMRRLPRQVDASARVGSEAASDV